MESVIYDLWLSFKFGTNTSKYRQLLEEYGSSEEIYKRPFPKDDVLGDKDLKQAQKELDRSIKEKVCIVSYTDDIYPESLRDIENAPPVLYCKGDLSLLKKPLLSIAGSKNCSPQGIANTRRFVKSVFQSNIIPVSAFSQGIEAEACRSVERSVIILPCGIDITYPAKQFSLKNKIIKNGGLVITEQPFGMKALGVNIVSRNRLIAAISPYLFIVEAGEKSRTGIIFDKCTEYQKGCFVIPGSITSEFYAGSNSFLKKGGIVVTSPEDIINFYKLLYPDEIGMYKQEALQELAPAINNRCTDPSEKAIINALNSNRLNYDELVQKSGLSAADAAGAITMLEMQGIIENIGGFFAVK